MAGRGRPATGDSFRKVRIYREQVEDLELVAAAQGIPVAEAIRRAISTYINEHERKARRRSA